MGEIDLSALLAQAQQMQQQLADAQEQASATEVHGSAGGGAVSVSVTGGFEATAVRIDASVIDPEDPDLLGDLVLAALRDALGKARATQSGALGGLDDLAGGLGGVAGLGGLLGGSPGSDA